MPKQSKKDLVLFLLLFLKRWTADERIWQIITSLLCRLRLFSVVEGLCVNVEPCTSLKVYCYFFFSIHSDLSGLKRTIHRTCLDITSWTIIMVIMVSPPPQYRWAFSEIMMYKHNVMTLTPPPPPPPSMIMCCTVQQPQFTFSQALSVLKLNLHRWNWLDLICLIMKSDAFIRKGKFVDRLNRDVLLHMCKRVREFICVKAMCTSSICVCISWCCTVCVCVCIACLFVTAAWPWAVWIHQILPTL